MPARLAQVVLTNKSRYPIRWLDDHLDWGDWQNPWWPSKIQDLQPGNKATFRSESGGPFSGTEGWALFLIDVPLASNVGDRAERLKIKWNLPYLGAPDFPIPEVSFRNPADQPKLTYAVITKIRNMGTGESILEQWIASGLLTPFPILGQDTVPAHISLEVELRNTEEGATTLPITLAAQGIIYTITDNNDLMWYRHDGRADGTFNWAFNEGKKVGNGWSVKHIFSGGDGVIYTITDNNDLMWYRHDGRADGTFNWAFNEGKKVGNGWSVKHIFSGGDGVIYTITDNNDLMWYRHDGRADGTFNWAFNEGKKVGNGWSVKHIFSGGDGVIYTITDNNDLMWYRHDGRADGTFNWAFNEGKKVGNGWSVKHIFSGGDGVIYTITDNNDLMWYRHDGRADGTFNWAFNEGKKVGNGWSVKQVFSG